MDKNHVGKNDEDRTFPPKTRSERIRSILTDGKPISDGIQLNQHSLFTQLDVLVHCDGGKRGWKQIARWLKYEETVEIGDRWSKPHVPTAQLHALMELRRVFDEKRCTTGLGVSATTDGPCKVADTLVETLKREKGFSDDICRKIRATILLPHKHKDRKTTGKKHQDQNGNVSGFSSDEGSGEGHEEHKKKTMLRRRAGDGKDIAAVYHNYPHGAKPDNLAPYKPNKHLTKKLPKDCESANLLVGQVDFLTETVMLFCRLEKESVLADLTEVDVPARFLFLVLGPTNGTNIWEFQELGRAMAALLSDKVFCDIAYKAKTSQDIVDGIDEFLDDLTVLPPSLWDPSIRLEPQEQTISMDKILDRLDEDRRQPSGPTAPHQEEGASEDQSLMRTGRLFGGLIHDVRTRYSYYLSDFRDALHIQSVASTIFLFFACITPIVTFGGLMGQKTDGYMGTMETLMAGAVCGVLFSAFAGQPLIIVGATGPLLIFESILYQLCKDNNLEFMSLRFWIGAWVAVILLFMVAFDLSVLVRYITRFTEESFSILISVIFIYEAFAKIAEIYFERRVHTGLIRETKDFQCYCQPGNQNFSDFIQSNKSFSNFLLDEYTESCLTTNNRIVVRYDCISESQCRSYDWVLNGTACSAKQVIHAVPDVFFLSLILFVGTFALAMFFRIMRTSQFFPSRVRSTIADFAVFLSVVAFTGIDYLFGIDTPKLNVPEEFVTTRDDRSWLVNPMAITVWWLIPLAFIPALLATILIFLDQQITAVIVNRKEHKLKKGHGYHLDLFVLAFLIFICSLMGLPWFVAATVRAITHVRSLFTESEVSVPGEKPQIVGVREQRVTGIAIHVLIGLSTLLTSVLRLIPMPVLYGVFMYMGVTSLGSVQFIERVSILLMPAKYQPDYIYLRHVKTSRVHIFTAVQIICFGMMWAIKTVKITAIAFPVMLVALMTVRKLLDFVFTQSELYWLDHLLPDELRREKEDEERKHAESKLKSDQKIAQPYDALSESRDLRIYKTNDVLGKEENYKF